MERRQQVEEIFHAALQRDPAERETYLCQACGDDSGLRREVTSLLAHHSADDRSGSWAAAAAAQLVNPSNSLQPGQSLGPYRIESFLASGGMGEVYRATDTRLNRQVAIKVSAERFGERFEREARVIASLNHPNICQLYDVGPNYLLMELVGGPTLAERLRQGPLPLDEALAISRQIAQALEAAHEKGIVHRDLKPANVKINAEGVVKVLDFGLAKATETPMPAGGNATDSPTVTISPTRAGMILGTAAYMSPEQARGTAVDKRADIWAFGCVLYEMLTGKQAFHGETTSDILAAVLRAEPEWKILPAMTPPRIRKLLGRCLERERTQRLRDIGEARIAIDAPEEAVPRQRMPARLWPWVAGTAIALCLAAVGWWRATRSDPLAPAVRLSVELSPDAALDRQGGFPALSPDGTRLAFTVRGGDGRFRLATRRLDRSEIVPLPGTEGAGFPLFSPDGEWIAFNAGGKVKKIAVEGGTPVALCDISTMMLGGSWENDDIIAPLGPGTGLSRIPSAGGTPSTLTVLNREKNELAHRWPQVLPGGQAILFTVHFNTRNYNDSDIDVLSLRTGERKTVHRGGFFGRYLPSGHLVYVHQNTLFAAPFDLTRLALSGTPQPVADSIPSNSMDIGGLFAFSRNGTAVYLNGEGQLQRSIFWLDSTARLQPLRPDPRLYGGVRFSPDGKRLAFSMENAQGGRDIWVNDLERGIPSRLTMLPGESNLPVWTPDGKDIIFHSQSSAARIYWIHSDNSGEPQPLTDGKARLLPWSFSPDGKHVFGVQPSIISGGVDIWTAPLDGDRDHPRLGKVEPFLQSAAIKLGPVVSPNGPWLAYQSNESGRNEVYVRAFPGPGGVWQISTGGGLHPMWSYNGRELFFLSLDGRIMVANYTAEGDAFVFGGARVWSERGLPNGPGQFFGFGCDLAPDGKRFAVVLFPNGTAEQKSITHLTFVLNFFDDLRRRVPARGR